MLDRAKKYRNVTRLTLQNYVLMTGWSEEIVHLHPNPGVGKAFSVDTSGGASLNIKAQVTYSSNGRIRITNTYTYLFNIYSVA